MYTPTRRGTPLRRLFELILHLRGTLRRYDLTDYGSLHVMFCRFRVLVSVEPHGIGDSRDTTPLSGALQVAT